MLFRSSRPGDLIFFQLSINIYPFNYYYLKDFKGTTNETRKNGAILSRPEKRYIDEGGLKEAGINQFDINYLNCKVLPYKKVWYIYSMADYMDPDKLVLKWFSNNYNLRDSVIFQNWNTTNTITIGEFEKK